MTSQVLPAVHPVLANAASHLLVRPTSSSARSSSWDRTGGNRDFITVEPGETATLLDHQGPGCVNHFYVAMVMPEITDYRDAIVRCYWDGAREPSVEVPLGDFFGLSHGRIREFSSQVMAVNPGFGPSHGLNCYLPMPFSERGLITLENRGEKALGGPHGAVWFHVDYEVYTESLPSDVLRFHARFQQELRTGAVGDAPNVVLHKGTNLTGADNYVALATRGAGSMVGLHLEIDNQAGDWYGEGDDMVFVDGQNWPPAIHGTGTEEIFGGGACPSREYRAANTGFNLIESPDFDGLVGMYRWFYHDPIRFRESLRWTLEHGHANNFANGYASVAYWYQEPLATDAPPLPSRSELLPRLDPRYPELRDRLYEIAKRARSEGGTDAYHRACRSAEAFYRGDWDLAERRFAEQK